MSNVVEAYFNNRTPEVEALYEAFQRGEVDIFGNRKDAPGYSVGTSSNNPNLRDTSVLGNPGASTENILADNSTNTGGANILNDSSTAPLTSMFELNNLYKEILGREFTDGDEIFNYYTQMSPEAVREELFSSPEAQIYRQATGTGGTLSPTERTELLGIAQTGYGGILDVNQDGVVNINDLLIDMGRAGIGENILPISAAVDETNNPFNANVQEPVNLSEGFGTTPTTQALSPYYKNLVRMQITPGSNFLDAPVSGEFYGIDPTTNTLGILSDPTNVDIKTGLSAFTQQKPTGFEFGIPAVIADVPIYFPRGYEDFLSEKEAEEAEAKKNRYTFQGMGSDFDQSRLNET